MDRRRILKRLRACLPRDGLITEPRAVKPYETDGLTAIRQAPWAVALPRTEAEVEAVLAVCREHAGAGGAARRGHGLVGWCPGRILTACCFRLRV